MKKRSPEFLNALKIVLEEARTLQLSIDSQTSSAFDGPRALSQPGPSTGELSLGFNLSKSEVTEISGLVMSRMDELRKEKR